MDLSLRKSQFASNNSFEEPESSARKKKPRHLHSIDIEGPS